MTSFSSPESNKINNRRRFCHKLKKKINGTKRNGLSMIYTLARVYTKYYIATEQIWKFAENLLRNNSTSSFSSIVLLSTLNTDSWNIVPVCDGRWHNGTFLRRVYECRIAHFSRAQTIQTSRFIDLFLAQKLNRRFYHKFVEQTSIFLSILKLQVQGQRWKTELSVSCTNPIFETTLRCVISTIFRIRNAFSQNFGIRKAFSAIYIDVAIRKVHSCHYSDSQTKRSHTFLGETKNFVITSSRFDSIQPFRLACWERKIACFSLFVASSYCFCGEREKK